MASGQVNVAVREYYKLLVLTGIAGCLSMLRTEEDFETCVTCTWQVTKLNRASRARLGVNTLQCRARCSFIKDHCCEDGTFSKVSTCSSGYALLERMFVAAQV